MRRGGASLWLAAALALAPGAASARPDVTCTAANATIDFGSYDVLGGVPLDGTGSVTVTCVRTAGGPASVVVAYTAKLAPAAGPRRLAPPVGVDRLTYDLYVDSARTQLWGDGTGRTFPITGVVVVPRNSSVTDAPKTFYGRIAPGGQDVSAASPPPPPTVYSEGLVVTVSCVTTGGGGTLC